MSDRVILVAMAHTLLKDTQEIQQRGAGYYTTAPFVQRYNTLIENARTIFADTDSQLLDTFTPVEDTTSVDPMDKMKTTQRVIVELGQLLAFMEAALREAAAQDAGAAEATENAAPDEET